VDGIIPIWVCCSGGGTLRGPKNGRYFDWRLFAFLLNAVVVLLLVHVKAKTAHARSDVIRR